MERLADPAVNAERRDRVAAFAERETWDKERTALAGAYAEAVGR